MGVLETLNGKPTTIEPIPAFYYCKENPPVVRLIYPDDRTKDAVVVPDLYTAKCLENKNDHKGTSLNYSFELHFLPSDSQKEPCSIVPVNLLDIQAGRIISNQDLILIGFIGYWKDIKRDKPFSLETLFPKVI